jgi:hypothetical protein
MANTMADLLPLPIGFRLGPVRRRLIVIIYASLCMVFPLFQRRGAHVCNLLYLGVGCPPRPGVPCTYTRSRTQMPALAGVGRGAGREERDQRSRGSLDWPLPHQWMRMRRFRGHSQRPASAGWPRHRRTLRPSLAHCPRWPWTCLAARKHQQRGFGQG